MRPSSSGRLKSRAVSRAMGCWRGRSYCLPQGLAFTPEFPLLRGGSAAGVGRSQHQSTAGSRGIRPSVNGSAGYVRRSEDRLCEKALCVELLTVRPCGEKDGKDPQPFLRRTAKEALQTGTVQILRFLQSTQDLLITLCVQFYADPFRQILGRLAGLAPALRACQSPLLELLL